MQKQQRQLISSFSLHFEWVGQWYTDFVSPMIFTCFPLRYSRYNMGHIHRLHAPIVQIDHGENNSLLFLLQEQFFFLTVILEGPKITLSVVRTSVDQL